MNNVHAPRTSAKPPRGTHYASRFALLLIILLAAYLRLNHLEWTEFKLDEAHLSQLAYDMARHGQIPLTGIGSSVGVVNPPLAAWVLAIPYALSASPIVATGFIAAVNVLAVIGCFGLARKLFDSRTAIPNLAGVTPHLPVGAGVPSAARNLSRVRQRGWPGQRFLVAHALSDASRRGRARRNAPRNDTLRIADPRSARAEGAALIAALLFAVAPWAVIHSRKVWAQDLLPPFVMLWAWFGYRAFVEGKRWSLIGHGLMLAAAIQLHYSAVYLIPVSVVWFIAFVKRVKWQAVIATGLLIAAAFAPFLIADGLRGWPSVTRLMAMTSQPVTVDDSTLHLAWITTVGQEIHSLAGPQEFENYRAQIIPADVQLTFEGVLVIFGLLLALSDVVRSAIKRAWSAHGAIGLWLAVWLMLPIVTQIGHRTPVYPHYFIILYPVQFLFIGWLLARLSKWTRLVLVGALLLVAVIQTQHTLVLQSFLASRPTPGGAGMPIGYYESIVREAVQAKAEHGAAEIVINTRGVDPAVDESPAIWSFLLNDVPHRFVDAFGAARVFPKETNIQIDFVPDAVMPRPVAERKPIGRVVLRTGEQPADIYAVAPYASIGFVASGSPLARWANGTDVMWLNPGRLLPGQTGTIEFYVRVDETPAPALYQWTTQLFDRQGKRWAQVDAAGYPAAYWRSGDVIGYEFGLSLPGDLPDVAYVLRMGQYTLPDVATVPVIDAAGLPQSDAFEFEVSVNP